MDTPQRRSQVRPFVVAHVAVSVDGVTTGFTPEVARFYALSEHWHEDATLAGADTVLAQEEALARAAGPGPTPGAPLLAVVDGRARVRRWAALRDTGHWSRVLALRCDASPLHAGAEGAEELVVGGDRVDLDAALRALRTREGAAVVRVDSGGSLNGALLEHRLLDEVSLLVHPVVVGAASAQRWWGGAEIAASRLSLVAADRVDDLVWLRYRLDERPDHGRRVVSAGG